MTAQINRRSLLVVAGVPAEAMAETRIVALYREHVRLTAAALEYHSGLSGDAEDELLDRLFYEERDRIEDELLSLPCQTPGCFAAKVIIATCKGQLFPDWDSGGIWAEARALVGAGVAGTSPLRALYDEWQAAKTAYNNSGLDTDNPRELEMYDAIISCEERAAEFIPQTIEDYAMKIIFADDDGDMDMNQAQIALVEQAHELAGIKPRRPVGGGTFVEAEA